ncbi:hypothetical protein [uncultured Desulfuromusa sp.]|uniref:hypothetical protein n=1 Tax=uncultured Desulfuromusa sp. TaxID=219183 RepID=UPI002AA8D953|nr:hypothetical protein [uncultured Desulfuromusa sp.]
MHNPQKAANQEDHFQQNHYDIKTLEDEIKADNKCKEILKQFHSYLLNHKKIDPISAGSLASGTDYFLRDYMIDNQRSNIFRISSEQVRSFAGNWYIINTIEPNMVELENILVGISHFYRFCAEKKAVSQAKAEEIHQTCICVKYYQHRIESFNDISGDGFIAWNKACPLQK